MAIFPYFALEKINNLVESFLKMQFSRTFLKAPQLDRVAIKDMVNPLKQNHNQKGQSTPSDYIMRDNNRRESPHLNSSVNSTVTQPVAEPRNVRRSKLIKSLHVEFEDLKKKIKDVQYSNECVRNMLHSQDFKKGKRSKETYEARSIVHYENQQDQSQVNVKRGSQKDQSESQFKGAIRKNPNVKKAQPQPQVAFQHSIEFQKTEEPIYQRDHFEMSNQSNSKSNDNMAYRQAIPPPSGFIYSPISQYTIPQQPYHINQFNGLNPNQFSVQYPPYPQQVAIAQSRSVYQQKATQLEELLKQESEKVKILEQALEERQQDMVAFRRLQKKYNNVASDYSDAMQTHLQDFFDSVLKKKLSEIDKCVKKNENKLKKLQLRIKDKVEDTRSKRIISEHREKRSKSRSKQSRSPREHFTTVISPPQRLSSKRSTYQPSIPNENRSKKSQVSHQHFEEIATQYQQIIKTKTKENDQIEARLKEKQKELLQMASKCAKLELKISDLTDIPKAARSRKYSQKEENLLANLVFDNEPDILSLNRKISELQGIIASKDKEISMKDATIGQCDRKITESTNKIRKFETEINKLREQSKRSQNQEKSQQNLIKSLKKLQADLMNKQTEYSQLKQKCSKFENEKIKKECQNITLSNKIKKLQNQLLLKSQKLAELQKIIQSNVGHQQNQLDKSIYLEKYDQRELQSLQEEKEKLEEELLKQRQTLFAIQKDNEQLKEKCAQLASNNDNLKKEVQSLLIHNQSMRITLKAQEFEKYKVEPVSSPLQKLMLEGDCLSEDEDESLIRSELEELKKKYQQSQNLLKFQNQKTFQENRKVLKLTSQTNYLREQLSDRQSKYQKLRKQYEEVKCQISQLQQTIQMKDSDLQLQRQINAERIKDIQNKFHEFQQNIKNKYEDRLDGSHNSQEMAELKNSQLRSESSFANYRITYDHAHMENEKLLERIKQADKIIEVQKEMEDRIVNEYRINVERIKAQLRQKVKENERLSEELEGLTRKIRIFENSQNRQKAQEKTNIEETVTQKMIELQMEISDMREISSKREGVQQELYHQINEKEKELQEMAVKLTSKERRIEELQDLLQLKEMNISSHISNSQLKPKMRESIQSHNSLRYSILSSFTNRDKTIQLDLSQVGQSGYDHNQSMISNVSQVFARQEFPYEKMQLKRVQQRRLFQKTAAYIKSLKKAIDQKNKKIKLLEKKIESLRNSQLVRKDIYEIKNDYNDFQPDSSDIFKDYSSVQLESSHSKRYRLKQLEHETKLTIEQNNLLNNQIQSMQEELLKAEEQEDSLMKLKDLYKEEIKNLIKQNQDQMKAYQDGIKKEKQKIQQSESIQTMEALKQIFLKIVKSFIGLQCEGPNKTRKRQEKKKELQDFLKVCCNLFNFDPQTREKLIAEFRQMKR